MDRLHRGGHVDDDGREVVAVAAADLAAVLRPPFVLGVLGAGRAIAGDGAVVLDERVALVRRPGADGVAEPVVVDVAQEILKRCRTVRWLTLRQS